jgi:hypothetical protein
MVVIIVRIYFGYFWIIAFVFLGRMIDSFFNFRFEEIYLIFIGLQLFLLIFYQLSRMKSFFRTLSELVLFFLILGIEINWVFSHMKATF